ncbi:hypothetical protein C5B42_02035 [Candidatus Cerribacteria bacterium 'Amazon FNV 2010 28 9']|uniref:SCP domain-containing protein n=1 Tax=Candidatus Cerribacteria bacterium 'Amazon FNV 2010 28 9' TaxID=2081795 RepID=A0A317JQK7_9BACT|nr:MAG: hypothetical protein C5B42_02035 [Candidatus Cerribacteria bacterium 'Amazon FNV 2010 28 9']
MKKRNSPHSIITTFLFSCIAFIDAGIIVASLAHPQILTDTSTLFSSFIPSFLPVQTDINTSPLPSPTLLPKKLKQPQSTPPDNTQWGVAKQIDGVTWTMKIGEDSRQATPREVLDALNTYRKQHNSPPLTWDDHLAAYAQTRANYLESIHSTDDHKGFEAYVQDENNVKALGFWELGENCAYGYQLLAVHWIEWVFSADPGHDKNQLDSSYSHAGVGINGKAISIIFGGWKIQ